MAAPDARTVLNTPLFTPSNERFNLLHHAAIASRFSGAAITGPAAAEREDRWLDIDLAFGVADAADLANQHPRGSKTRKCAPII